MLSLSACSTHRPRRSPCKKTRVVFELIRFPIQSRFSSTSDGTTLFFSTKNPNIVTITVFHRYRFDSRGIVRLLSSNRYRRGGRSPLTPFRPPSLLAAAAPGVYCNIALCTPLPPPTRSPGPHSSVVATHQERIPPVALRPSVRVVVNRLNSIFNRLSRDVTDRPTTIHTFRFVNIN